MLILQHTQLFNFNMPNSIRRAIEEKDVQFQQLFTSFQANLRRVPNYINFDAFRDLKIIFELYSETYHLKGFNYNSLKVSDIEKILLNFDDFKKKELVDYLIKSLVKNGIEEKAKELFSLFAELEIKCACSEIKKGKNITKNFLKLIHNLTAYNNYTLILSPLIFAFFMSLIYANAPFQFMELIHIEKTHFSNNFYLNHIANVMIYLFDMDDKMKVTPLSFMGVLLMIVMKSFLIIIVINFFLKEFFNRIKLSK